MPQYPSEIDYSDKYNDDCYEYRHVILTKTVTKRMQELTGGKRLMTDKEWRSLGVTQSLGWEHYVTG